MRVVFIMDNFNNSSYILNNLYDTNNQINNYKLPNVTHNYGNSLQLINYTNMIEQEQMSNQQQWLPESIDYLNYMVSNQTHTMESLGQQNYIQSVVPTQIINSNTNYSYSIESNQSNISSTYNLDGNTIIINNNASKNEQLQESHQLKKMPPAPAPPQNEYNNNDQFLVDNNLMDQSVKNSLTANKQQPNNIEFGKHSSNFCCKESTCNKSYSTISGLNNHIKKKHSGISSYPCDECSESFAATHERTMHKIKLHDGRRYQTLRHAQANSITKFKCTIVECGKEFNNLITLEKHDAVHKIKNSNIQSMEQRCLHKCESCDEVFNLKSDLLKHKRHRHMDTGEYPCPECSKVFYTIDMYKEHRSLHDENVPKHTCNECGKLFITLRKLKEHSIIHQERIMFKCDVCSKVFVRSQTLQYHRITCKAAYPCDNCVDSFMTAEALEKHKAFHKNDNNFTCLKCNKVFSTQIALRNHEKRHSLRMNYTCQICKDTVSTRAKFQKHIKDHLESNLKCGVCDEEFQSLVKYGYHKAEMHAIMRPYDCVLCKDEFCTRQELFIHLHNHTGKTQNSPTSLSNKEYECEECSIKFAIKLTYEQHIKSHQKNTINSKVSIRDDTVLLALEDDQTSSSSSSSLSESVSTSLPMMLYENELLTNTIIPTTIPITNSSICANITVANTSTTKSDTSIKYPCLIKFCNKIFSNENDLKQHKIEFHVNNMCCTFEGCKFKFQNQHDLKRHLSIHALKTYECHDCKKIYYSDQVYQLHVSLCKPKDDDLFVIADEDNDSGPIVCQLCKQLFENKKVLKYHRKFCVDENVGDINNSQNWIELNGHQLQQYPKQLIEEIYVKPEIDDIDLLNIVPEL